MTLNSGDFVKILIRFQSDVLDEWIDETMWAEIVDEAKGFYKIENIPFYAPIASGDIVFAEYDETGELLIYKETVEYSGNSLIQVVILDKSVLTNDIREIFHSLDCRSEKLKEGYFALEILADNDYRPINQKLTELQNKGIIDYAEAVLSDKHQAWKKFLPVCIDGA